MREILFRGKRIDNGEWVCSGVLIHFNEENECYIPATNGKCQIALDETDNIIGMKETQIYKVLPETVGQYTGLTDKNGKKIFEGDIVDILTENEEIGVITYDEGGFVVKADGFCVDFHNNINGTDLEVIGSIHDNPELPKGE